jgi:hypothetical protein
MIAFFRGDNHKEKFRFKNFTGAIDNLFFTVKDINKKPVIKKKLNDGISFKDEWYIIDFLPEDTNNLPFDIEMPYDIQIITGGEKYTVEKGIFILDEDITTPDCEV